MEALLVDGIHARARIHARLGALDLTLLARDHQRRHPVVVALVHERVALQEQPRDVSLAGLTRRPQRRAALVVHVHDGDVGAELDQSVRLLQVALAARLEELRTRLDGLRLLRAPLGDPLQHLHRVGLVQDRGGLAAPGVVV